ncbi:zinc-dependent metalloprotease [Candidatus Marinimicrobia bacterium]|nr:zinc-dependent metalloprotease [Candidatus Neomarinimicrobiota bacterium]
MLRIIILLFVFISSGYAQVEKPTETTQVTTGEQKSNDPPKMKSMEEALKGKKEIPGLFNLFQDEKEGKLFMLIKKEQLDKEYIHFVHGLNGQMNTGVMKGGYRGSKIFTLKRYFNRVEFEIQNNSFYFDAKSPLSRASESNISTAILASSNIISEKDGALLIGVDNLFLTESLHQITRGFIPGGLNKNPFKIGRLAKERTKYKNIKNYPENTDFIVQYVYSNPMPTNYGSDKGLTDPRSVNVSIQHSFIKMPENNYQPRYEDPRVGYFTTQVTDMTSPDDPTPYRDLIHRWHLEKKNPAQERSEVKDPIVWWIENTTPLEFRDAIKEGVLAWNKAFEKAGLINAVEVKIQPDNAEWDAGDIRYNVLRWTSSPNPPFGGYGPSFVNPRTGQILGADIMLEYVYFTNRVNYEKIFETFNGVNEEPHKCNIGHYIQQGNYFGQIASKSLSDYSQLEQHRIIYESLVRLALHEVGHTHGLNHNFASSYLHSFNNIHDRHITEPIGLTSSVMEYPSVNVGLNSNSHGQFYTTVPGPYDLWAIEYGYTPPLENPEDEKERVKSLLDQSSKPELLFGNDVDDMRSPGRGIDPRFMIYDMSDDPVSYAEQRMDIVRSLYPDLRNRYEVKGGSYHAFKDAFMILNREYSLSARIISRQIGGVYTDRDMIGQEGKEKPFIPVPKDQQKWSMTLLNKYIFSPEAYSIPGNIFNYLQWERRGFSGTKDPNILDMYLNTQKDILNHLLNIKVMKRISNTEMYGNKYTLNEMMNDLTTACFSADAGSNVNLMRRNLQVEYSKRLIQVVLNKSPIKYDNFSVSAALENLNKIKKYASRYNGVDEATKAHRKYLIYIIDKSLDA